MIYHTKWGDFSGTGGGAQIIDTVVGSYSNIAANCKIGLRDHVYENFHISDITYKREHILPNGLRELDGYWVKIGSDVWICQDVIITRGVEIGDGAVVAAGSVVTKSVPPYAVVGGNPAKFIKWRFSADVIDKLEAIRWFDWPLDKILLKRNELEKLVNFNMDEYKLHYCKKKKPMHV